MKIDHAWVARRAHLGPGDDPAAVDTLSIPGIHDDKISELGDALGAFSSLTSLDLSRNVLTSLASLPVSAPHLKKLNLYYNRIPDFDALAPLDALAGLSDLDLRLNPVAKKTKDYRLRMIARFPTLVRLDERDIRESERRAAARLAPRTSASATGASATSASASSASVAAPRPHAPSPLVRHPPAPAHAHPPLSPSLLEILSESPRTHRRPRGARRLELASPDPKRSLNFDGQQARHAFDGRQSRSEALRPRDALDGVVDGLMAVLAEGPTTPDELRAKFRSHLAPHVLMAPIPAVPRPAAAPLPSAEVSHLESALAREKEHSAQMAATIQALNAQIGALTTELDRSALSRDETHAVVDMLKETHALVLADNKELRNKLAASERKASETAALWKANFDDLVATIGRGAARQPADFTERGPPTHP